MMEKELFSRLKNQELWRIDWKVILREQNLCLIMVHYSLFQIEETDKLHSVEFHVSWPSDCPLLYFLFLTTVFLFVVVTLSCTSFVVCWMYEKIPALLIHMAQEQPYLDLM